MLVFFLDLIEHLFDDRIVVQRWQDHHIRLLEQDKFEFFLRFFAYARIKEVLGNIDHFGIRLSLIFKRDPVEHVAICRLQSDTPSRR